MIARSRVVVEAGGALRTLACRPPLTLRRVWHEDPQVCALCLVNSAAGPLAGDEIDLELTVEDWARVELSAAGAAIAQGRSGAGRSGAGRSGAGQLVEDPSGAGRSVQRATVSVGEGGDLRAVCAPLIAARGCAVDVSVEIRLGSSASVHWQELLVLGRTGEEAGQLSMSWNVLRAGAPVLRQFVDLTDARLRDWPGMLGRGRVLATAFISSPALEARTVAADPSAVIQAIDEHTILATVLDVSAASAATRLSALLPSQTAVSLVAR